MNQTDVGSDPPAPHSHNISPVSIAAASIIAKVHRDEYLQKLSKDMPQYNIDSNVGYGTKRHIEAIKKFGPSTIHRNSFKPVKDFV